MAQQAGGSPTTMQRVPTARPPFTIGTLRKAIPAHCFERSLLKSSAYLGASLAAAAALFALATTFHRAPLWLAYGLLWPAYWFCQGAVLTGVWVVAHECGHGAFSKWTWVNDAVGFVFHSALLVPYYSWKHSHRRHHSNTGSLAKDEVFVPSTEPSLLVALLHAPWYRAGFLAVQQLLGWPLYLAFNSSGREYSRWASHFDPSSPIFTKRERIEVVLSDVGILAMGALLWQAAQLWGWGAVVQYYGIPYLWVNSWLVMITFLQHTHPALPHYDDAEWDWLRGALATVDRSYGKILNVVFHHITDTHVAHHLFSQMPHYHAMEATEAIKPILGQYYAQDNRPIWRALWEEAGACAYVQQEAPGSGVYWFHTSRGAPAPLPQAAAAAAKKML